MGSLPAAAEATRFGKYSLVARLATGGMAEIFLARLHGAAGFEKLVCIKRILPHLARDKQFIAMFFDEARIAARISHPNVCQVFELGEIEGSYYIAMEYLEGVPLGCFRRRAALGLLPDPRLVAGIAIQACEALHHAHQLKNTDGSVMEVVHRDVSPQNVFVTVDGIVKILDFGIAKAHGAHAKTGTGAIKGTSAYMSPEQLRGERVDRRTDVFALGIVMWELLAGQYLFRRDTEFLTFLAIASDPIGDITAVRPDLPPALAGVIMCALGRDREHRFATARAFGEALAGAVSPLGVPAISDEIARAFPGELGDQAQMIRVAREGGAFSLDVERGPSTDPGPDATGALTTPTSDRRALVQAFGASDILSRPGAPVPASLDPPNRQTGPIGHVAVSPLPQSGERSGDAMPVEPWSEPRGPVPSRQGVRWRPLVIAAVALGLGAAAAYIYARISRGAGPLPAPGAGSAVALVVAAAPDAPALDAAAPDAPAVDAAAVAASPDAPAVDAAAVEPASPAAKPAVSAAPAAVKPSGPPGFITIDSTPVYAVIRIDGKNYGETPVVNIPLSPGRHRVHAVTQAGGTRDVWITIVSGKVAPASRIEW